jgi:hypothetical protein
MVSHKSQLFITFFMFLVSRKFHSGWGIPGTEVEGTAMQQKTEQGRGWEWYVAPEIRHSFHDF